MSFLLKKSHENYNAVTYLIDVKCFASAVHCGYYSCIQKIIYILKEFYTDEYELGLKQIQGGHGNRHKFYIEEFSGRLSDDRRERRKMKNLLFAVKWYRKNSN